MESSLRCTLTVSFYSIRNSNRSKGFRHSTAELPKKKEGKQGKKEALPHNLQVAFVQITITGYLFGEREVSGQEISKAHFLTSFASS